MILTRRLGIIASSVMLVAAASRLASADGYAGTWKGTTPDVTTEIVLGGGSVESIAVTYTYTAGKNCSQGSTVVEGGTTLRDSSNVKFNPGQGLPIANDGFRFATPKLQIDGHFLSPTQAEGTLVVPCADRPLKWQASKTVTASLPDAKALQTAKEKCGAGDHNPETSEVATCMKELGLRWNGWRWEGL